LSEGLAAGVRTDGRANSLEIDPFSRRQQVRAHGNREGSNPSGIRLCTAGDGEEALRIAQAASPDIIRLDMLRPKLSGPEVLRAPKINPLTAVIPVIVLSGLSQKNEAKLVKDGAAAYFEKSRLDLHQNPETLLELGKKTRDGLAGLTVSEILPQRELGTSALAVIAGSYSQ
jgi:CheY-like chemotaxis protein